MAPDANGREAMAAGPPAAESSLSRAALLAALEALSRARPDRVLRLRGSLPAGALESSAAAAETGRDPLPRAGEGSAAAPLPLAREPFELLIFRGFSSLTTHATAFDPDRAALPETARISSAELLAAPLDPDGGVPLAGPVSAETFLAPESWA